MALPGINFNVDLPTWGYHDMFATPYFPYGSTGDFWAIAEARFFPAATPLHFPEIKTECGEMSPYSGGLPSTPTNAPAPSGWNLLPSLAKPHTLKVKYGTSGLWFKVEVQEAIPLM